ncbi:MAG TPA: 6-bladed beta-propeller, partial [Solirubrobacteraceae bacterium]
MPRSILALLAGALIALAAPADAAAQLQPSILGADPPSGHGVLRFPQALAFSPGGAFIWVADQRSSVVQEFARDGTWVKDVGWRADDRETGRLGTVGGLAVDRAGHLYVLDSENDRVQVFRTDDGTWLGAWGSNGTQTGAFRLGDNTGAGGLGLLQPTAGDPVVAYVADQFNHRIQRFTLSGFLPPGARDPQHATIVPLPVPDRVWGHHADCSDTGCADSAFNTALNYPQGVAVDPMADPQGRHRVFVADDDNHRVTVYDPNGGFMTQVGGFGDGPGQFRFPYDVGVDARNPRRLFVADNNNHRVQAFDAATLAFDRTWGSFGPAPGQLEFPRAVAAVADDPQGGVYVTDTAGNRVEGFDPDGNLVAAWGTAGRGPGYVSAPQGVAVDDDGRVYVADTDDSRIELLDPDGSYAGQWGYVSPNSGFAAPAAGAGQFAEPEGVAYDPLTGHVWVADTDNNRVQELGRDGASLAVYGGPSPGADAGQFSGPRGIAVGTDGAVYVADTGNDRVERRDPETGAWSVVDAGTPLHAPAGVAVRADGLLAVGDQGRVLRVREGAPAEALPPPPGTPLEAPDGLAFEGDRLYVTDAGIDRLLRFDLAGAAWQELGTEGNALGAFVQPEGVAVGSAADRIYVADAGNDRVQRLVDPAGPPPRALTVVVSGPGTVRSDPPGLECRSRCDSTFPAGTAVTLTATPDAGAVLDGWGGRCTGQGDCVVRLRDAAVVSAVFVAAPGPPPVAAPVPAPDRRAPVISGARVLPRAFRATRSPSGRRPRGARLRFRLSERATARVAIVRVAGGRERRIGTLRTVPAGPGTVALRLT